MHFRLIVVITTYILFSCQNSQTLSLKKEDVSKKGSFTYKTLIADTFIDSLRPGGIKDLFGYWTITAIGKTGGSSQNESEIQSQLGKRLQLDSNKVQFS